jgi:hypothetical protein
MNAIRPASLIVTFAMVFSNCATAAETNFFDGTFDLTGWTAIQVIGFDGTLSVSQITTGGNPGYYLQISHDNFRNTFADFHYRQDAVYFPSNIPNAMMDFSIDELAIENLNGIGIGVGVALQQDGTNYWGPSFVNSDFVWETLSVGNLRASDFVNFDPTSASLSGSAHPDFSTGGSAIQLGFATANNNVGTEASRSAGIDNWTFVVHQAPTLTNLTLTGGGLVQMQLLTTVGHSYTLEASTNLLDWAAILVANYANTNVVTLVDPNPVVNFAGRFYRVVDGFP